MPQQFCVLCCTQCQTFQVQILKKSPKWSCKMCGFKHAATKQYHVSDSSQECRNFVQELNLHRGQVMEQQLENGEVDGYCGDTYDEGYRQDHQHRGTNYENYQQNCDEYYEGEYGDEIVSQGQEQPNYTRSAYASKAPSASSNWSTQEAPTQSTNKQSQASSKWAKYK